MQPLQRCIVKEHSADMKGFCKKNLKMLPFLAFVIIVPVLHLLVVAIDKPFYLTQLTMAAYYALLVIGLSMVLGYAGQISLGHSAFFAMAGYTSAIMVSNDLSKAIPPQLIEKLLQFGIIVAGIEKGSFCFAPWFAAAVAIAITAIIAFLIGLPVLRLHGHYLAMATLAFGLIVYRIVLSSRICGEADGIYGIVPFNLPFGLVICGDSKFKVQNYYVAFTILFFGILLLYNLVNSSTGRLLRAIASNETAAAASGVDVAKVKLKAFVLSAIYAAVAGIMLTHYHGGIGPSEASIMKSVRYLTLVALGGMINLWGALISAIVMEFLSLRGCFVSLDEAVFGILLVVIMMVAPNGILSIRMYLRKNK